MGASSRCGAARLLGFGTALALAPAVAWAQQACNTVVLDQFSTTYLMGSTPGRVFVTYDMFGIPDRLDIFYGNEIVATTGGFVSDTDGSPLSFDYVPVGDDFTVLAVVTPSDSEGSAWDVFVGCPVVPPESEELSVSDRATATSVASSQTIAVRQIFRTQTQNFTRRLQNLRHGSGSGRVSISGLTLSYNGRSFSPDFGRGFSDRLAGGLIGLASAYSEQQDGSDRLPGSDFLIQRFTSPLLERVAARRQYAQFAQQHWAQSNWDQAWFKSRFQGEQTAQVPATGEIELPDRLGIFVNGIINFGDRNTTSSAAGFDFRNLGLSFGADYRITADLLLGIGGGVNFGRTDITGGSESDVDGYNVTAYGSWRPLDSLYVDGQLTYTFLDFDLERAVAGTGQRARGDRYGNQISGSITTGYEHYSDSLSFGPYVRLSYAHTSLTGFTETGVASPLEFESETLNSLTTTLGIRGDYAISTSSGIVLPYLRAEYEHEFKGSNNPAIVRFAGVPNSAIQLAAIPVDRNYFNLGGGVTFLMENAVSLFLDYESLVGFSDQSSHLFTIGIAARF